MVENTFDFAEMKEKIAKKAQSGNMTKLGSYERKQNQAQEKQTNLQRQIDRIQMTFKEQQLRKKLTFAKHIKSYEKFMKQRKDRIFQTKEFDQSMRAVKMINSGTTSSDIHLSVDLSELDSESDSPGNDLTVRFSLMPVIKKTKTEQSLEQRFLS